MSNRKAGEHIEAYYRRAIAEIAAARARASVAYRATPVSPDYRAIDGARIERAHAIANVTKVL